MTTGFVKEDSGAEACTIRKMLWQWIQRFVDIPHLDKQINGGTEATEDLELTTVNTQNIKDRVKKVEEDSDVVEVKVIKFYFHCIAS